MLKYLPKFELPETKRPIAVLGWTFLAMSSIALVTSAMAYTLKDSIILFISYSIGLGWWGIGALFVYLDNKFNN